MKALPISKVSGSRALDVITRTKPNFKLKKPLQTPFEEISKRCQEDHGLGPKELARLPHKWELFGEVLVLKLPQSLKVQWSKIASTYAEVLGAKAILRRYDKVRGTYRKPGVELLIGTDTETTHLENKVRFRFDPLRVMFSSGNIDERMRISTMARPNDTVVDMFAGIGYFCLPIAVHSRPSKVVACELNSVAYDYLIENIELNHVSKIVQPLLGDNRKAIPEGIADRVVMGYLRTEHRHREAAFNILKPTGGVIHFHDVGFKGSAVESAFKKIEESMTRSGYDKRSQAELISYYKIKSYGPKLVHVVLDVEIRSCSESV